MKTFFSVLAAGAILFSAFIGWQRIDRWEQGKHYWVSQLTTLKMPRTSTQGSPDEISYGISMLDSYSHARTHAAFELRNHLDGKPFGLPLTAEEKKILTFCVRIAPR